MPRLTLNPSCPPQNPQTRGPSLRQCLSWPFSTRRLPAFMALLCALPNQKPLSRNLRRVNPRTKPNQTFLRNLRNGSFSRLLPLPAWKTVACPFGVCLTVQSLLGLQYDKVKVYSNTLQSVSSCCWNFSRTRLKTMSDNNPGKHWGPEIASIRTTVSFPSLGTIFLTHL